MTAEKKPIPLNGKNLLDLRTAEDFDSLLNKLNFHHLYYFWVVASLGSIRRGSDHLLLSPPTVSRQIKELEGKLEIQLFTRGPHKLALTPQGENVRKLCDELFGIANQLVSSLSSRSDGHGNCVAVGLVGSVPRLIVYKVLELIANLPEPVTINCGEVAEENVALHLSQSTLDLVIAETHGNSPTLSPGAACYLISESPVVVCGSPSLANRYRHNFPQSLHAAPMLLPASGTRFREQLDQFFQENDVQPDIRGEFVDSTLVKLFGEAGHGLFCLPASIAFEVQSRYRCKIIGSLEGVLARYFALVPERLANNPIIAAVLDSARRTLSSLAE